MMCQPVLVHHHSTQNSMDIHFACPSLSFVLMDATNTQRGRGRQCVSYCQYSDKGE